MRCRPEASRSQSHASHARSNAVRVSIQGTSHHWQSTGCARSGTFPKPPTLEHTDQVCPVERPERCSTSLCRRQRSTSARHASSRAQLAAQHHIPANMNDMKHALCMHRRGAATCVCRSMLRSLGRRQLRADDTMAPWLRRLRSTLLVLSLWNSATCTSD